MLKLYQISNIVINHVKFNSRNVQRREWLLNDHCSAAVFKLKLTQQQITNDCCETMRVSAVAVTASSSIETKMTVQGLVLVPGRWVAR